MEWWDEFHSMSISSYGVNFNINQLIIILAWGHACTVCVHSIMQNIEHLLSVYLPLVALQAVSLLIHCRPRKREDSESERRWAERK